MRELVAEDRPLVTTNFVLAEFHALVLSRTDARSALRLLTDIETSQNTTVVRVEIEDELRARAILFAFADKDFSLTDAVSFAVMARLRISAAVAFDRKNLPESSNGRET